MSPNVIISQFLRKKYFWLFIHVKFLTNIERIFSISDYLTEICLKPNI